MRGLLFDKDGTLLDFEASWSRVYRELCLDLAEGDAAVADAMLVAGGFDLATGRFRAGGALAAGHTVDIVRMWYPALAGAALDAMVERIDKVFHENGVTCFGACSRAARDARGALRRGLRHGRRHQRRDRGHQSRARRARCRQLPAARLRLRFGEATEARSRHRPRLRRCNRRPARCRSPSSATTGTISRWRAPPAPARRSAF